MGYQYESARLLAQISLTLGLLELLMKVCLRSFISRWHEIRHKSKDIWQDVFFGRRSVGQFFTKHVPHNVRVGAVLDLPCPVIEIEKKKKHWSNVQYRNWPCLTIWLRFRGEGNMTTASYN
jgi:hypothetical protein